MRSCAREVLWPVVVRRDQNSLKFAGTRWRVCGRPEAAIDWLTVGMGSTHADFAHTLSLSVGTTDRHIEEFMIHVKRLGQERRAIGDEELHMWTRVAAARMSEGFDEQYIAFPRGIALGVN